MSLLDRILDDIRRDGPMTVAAFMERALYDPAEGYYTSVAQRSGRDGDFYTSIDAGPLFGQLLAELVFRVWALERPSAFDLVEAGAGNGRLTRDILDALRSAHPETYRCLSVTLVERSAPARAAQAAQLADHPSLEIASAEHLPEEVHGVVVANELLDAFPVHRVMARAGDVKEIYVGEEAGALRLRLGPPSDAGLDAYFARLGITLPEGAIADVSPAAVAWAGDAARRLTSGALLFIDYGHEAAELFSDRHLEGTLASYSRHQVDPPFPSRHPAWLLEPGRRDITAHVDFTSVSRAAGAEGARQQCLVDQTRLLLGLGLAERFAGASGPALADIKWRLAAKTIVGPQGLGASHRALLLAKGAADGARLLGEP